MNTSGVVPSYRVADGDVTQHEDGRGFSVERRLYRVRWSVASRDHDPRHLEDRLQYFSNNGWTIFAVFLDETVVLYRYEVDEKANG
jgi:hypothetical protein